MKFLQTDSAPLRDPVTCFSSNFSQSTVNVNHYEVTASETSSRASPVVNLNNGTGKMESTETGRKLSNLQRSLSVSNVNTLPKWRNAGWNSSAMSSSTSITNINSHHHHSGSICKKAEASCIPKPKDVRITKRFGSDGIVLAWNPPDHDCHVVGFCVVVGGQVVQKQMNAKNRTKTILTGLPMTSPCNIGLMYIGSDGRTSKPTVVTCDRSAVYAPSKAGASVSSGGKSTSTVGLRRKNSAPDPAWKSPVATYL